jgi:hypothetical protein
VLALLAERFTPGQPYSPEVAARQQQLEPLSTVLAPPAAQARVPAMPPGMRALTHVLAATAPVSPVGPTAPKETETAMAFDHVAHEIARRHPQLLTGPAGEPIANYVANVPVPGDSVGLELATPRAAPPKKRAKKTAKRSAKKKAKARIQRRSAKAKSRSSKSRSNKSRSKKPAARGGRG